MIGGISVWMVEVIPSESLGRPKMMSPELEHGRSQWYEKRKRLEYGLVQMEKQSTYEEVTLK